MSRPGQTSWDLETLASALGLVREDASHEMSSARLATLGIAADDAARALDQVGREGIAVVALPAGRGNVIVTAGARGFTLVMSPDVAGPQAMALHELANAMTLVVGLAERALQHAEPPDGEGRTGASAEILDRIARTARDGLHVARLVERSEGEMSERRVATRGDVAAVMSRVVDGLRRLATSRDVRVTLDLAATGSVANEHALAAISWNLVKNALEASPPGAAVTIRAARLDDRVTLVVSDEGGGVVARPRRRGRGVGLAVVKALVEALGGSFDLTARAPRGTEARVGLPVLAEEIETPARLESGPPRARLLLIEDDPALRQMLTDYLSDLGWHVRATADPWPLLASGARFDLALVDLHLHDERLSTAELARIRIHAPLLVAMTGEHASPTEVDRVLRKPFALDEVAEVVEELTAPSGAGRVAR